MEVQRASGPRTPWLAAANADVQNKECHSKCTDFTVIAVIYGHKLELKLFLVLKTQF